jgi:hypothetical protein
VNKQSTPSKQQSPAEAIAACESDIARLEQRRDLHIARGLDLTARRKALAYNTHVECDAESRKELDRINSEIATHVPELESLGDALLGLRGKLVELQALQAREERKVALKEQQKLSAEYRKIGNYLDLHLDHVRRGLVALAANASVVGRDQRHVALLHRCLAIAFFDTPFREHFPVPDANDRRSFSSFSGVVNGWCSTFEAGLEHELAALDGHEQSTEAAA